LLSFKSHLPVTKGGKMIKSTITVILAGTFVAAEVQNASLVSEPVTMLLLGVGLIWLAGLGRRKFVDKN
jgi:hypothetical protein